MGENPWESAEVLLRQKMGLEPEFEGNEKTREGQRLEPEARAILEKRHNTAIRTTLIQHAELPFLAASLDGLDDRKKEVYEIKCGQYAYRETSKRNQPAEHHMAQLQHILMITGFDDIFYAAYRPAKPLLIIKVHRNDRYIKHLRLAEEKFASELMKRGHQLQRTFIGSLCK